MAAEPTRQGAAGADVTPRFGLSPREWRTIVIGALLVVGAFIGTRWALPRWERHRARATRLERASQRLAELKGMVGQQAAFESRAATLERALADAPVRVLRASSTALGGNALQQYLASAVEGAGMVLDRVELDADPADPVGGQPTRVAAQAAIIGDIHGLAALLASLEEGPRRVTVIRLQIRHTSALRGAPDVLQIALGVSAPLMLDGEVP